MVKVKIFIESDLYYGQTIGYLFGYTTQSEESFTFYLLRSYTVVKNLNGSSQLFGEITDVNLFTITNIDSTTNFVHFIRGTDNILLNKIFIGGNSDVLIQKVQIILFDHIKWMQVSEEYDSIDHITEDCFKSLSRYIYKEFKETETLRKRESRWTLMNLQTALTAIIPAFNMVSNLTVTKHMYDWYHCLQNGTCTKKKLWNIASDVLAGFVIISWLLYLGKPGEYFMQFTEFVIYNVRILLNSLRGSPVGLKLNVELNNFFLTCFTYHVDLWVTFLVLVSPAIQYFFVPLAIIGCLGLSFQLALLSDLLVLTSIHAHCFYIYAAVYFSSAVDVQAVYLYYISNNVKGIGQTKSGNKLAVTAVVK